MSKLEKSNILFFAHAMGMGGTENVILQMCEALKSASKIVVCSCGGENVSTLEEMGIKHYVISDISSKSPSVMFKTYFSLCKICDKENINVIHVHDRMAAFYTSLYTMFHKRIDFFSTFHLNIENKKLLTRFSYRKSKIIACGKDVFKTLTNYYKIPQNQISVISNTISTNVEPSTYTDLNKYKLNESKLITNVSRLTEQKDVELFVKTFPKVSNVVNNVKYIIVGDGPLKNHLENVVTAMGSNENIIFLGNRKDAVALMRDSDLVVLSSDYEGYPLTPIEAFSQGKTIVATDVSGTNEIITDGYNGILVRPKDVDELARGIISVLTNPDLKNSLEQNAIKTYNERFDFEKYKEQIIQFYERHLH